MARFDLTKSNLRTNYPFWAISSLIVFTFLMGGSARPDAQSLIFLRPISFLWLGAGIFFLKREQIIAYKFLFVIAAYVTALAILHVIPLPPSIWQNLPGRELAVEAATATGTLDMWRPLSLTPYTSWNAIFSLGVPLAALVWGVQLKFEHHRRVLILLIAIGLMSGVLGLLQSVSNPNGPLYLYRITNNGAAVGLFANRNHQSLFLATLFPCLAAIISLDPSIGRKLKGHLWAVALACALIVPLILVTGARVGVILGAVGIASMFWLYRPLKSTVPEKRKHQGFRWDAVLGVAGIIGVALLTLVMSRASSIQRLVESSPGEDVRFSMWQPIFEMAHKYSPFGSGNGSFADMYRVDEPNELLGLNYLNHAHNDLLEVYMTLGWPAILAVLLVACAIIVGIFKNLRSPVGSDNRGILVRLGLVLVSLMAAAELVDYPLRVPSLVMYFTLASIWASSPRLKVVN